MPAAVTFDAAGTLFDLAEPVGVTYSRIARSFGVRSEPKSIEEAFRSAFSTLSPPHRLPPSTLDETGEDAERAWWRTLVRKVFNQARGASPIPEDSFAALFDTLFEHYAHPSAWQLAPGILEVLETLHRHTRLGIISNFDRRLYPISAGLGLSRHFEVVILSSEVGASKPDPVIFSAAAERFGLNPGEILHVGDDPVRDCEGARKSGFRVFPAISDAHPVTEILRSLGLSDG